MKPGEKIRLIEQSHDLLDERPWARQMLTLRQFGFDTYERDTWQPESDFEYVQSILSNGPEDRLLDLHAFLRGEETEQVIAMTTSPGVTSPCAPSCRTPTRSGTSSAR